MSLSYNWRGNVTSETNLIEFLKQEFHINKLHCRQMCKGKLRSQKKVKLTWKSVKTSHHWPRCTKWFSRYPISKSGIWARRTAPFCGFSASFSLNMTSQTQSFETMKKWKCNISGVFCSICLKLCRLLELSKGTLLHFKFRCYGNQTQNGFLLLRKRKVYCLSRSVFQKIIRNNTVW